MYEYVEIKGKCKTSSTPAYMDGCMAGGVYKTTYFTAVKKFNIPEHICKNLESACGKHKQEAASNKTKQRKN